MKKPRRKYRWLMWSSALGLVLTLAAAVYSEIWGVWYCQDPNGPSNFFALDRSAVTLIYYPNPPGGFFTGIPLYSQGWSTRKVMIRAFTPREWVPKLGFNEVAGSGYAHVRMPLWVPAFTFGGLAVWGWKMGGRRGTGECRKCGYDVRGVVGGVCPECGRATDLK